MTKPNSLLRAAGSIGLATSLSRVLGLLRDQVLAFYFGAGMVSDAYFAAFRVPSLLRDLFAEGALSSAFVPTFTNARERNGAEAAWALGNRLIGVVGASLLAVTGLVLVAAPWILRLYAVGFDPEKLALAARMTRILAPFLLFVALAAIAMGMLNSCGRFFVPALAPVAFNVVAIAGIAALVPWFRAIGWNPGLALAVGATLGGAMQWLTQAPALHREGFRLRPRFEPRDPGVRRVGRLVLPAVFGLAATQINILVDTQLASTQGDGPITFLTYAFRLMQLPIGLFGVSIATANLAAVSRNAAHGDDAALRGNFAASLRGAALTTLPATAGLVALREPIVRLLFERGAFSAEDTAMTGAAVLCYAAGLYAYAVTKIQVPTYYALGNTRIPVAASSVAVAVKIVASFALLELLPNLGIPAFLGLAIATSLAAWVNLALLAAGLRRRIGSLRRHRVLATTLAVAVLSAVMGTACAALDAWLESRLPGGGTAGRIGRLLAVILTGVAITVAGARMLGIEEARGWRRRLARTAGGPEVGGR